MKIRLAGIERLVQTPEGRQQVERLLELTTQALEKANEGLAAAKLALAESQENVLHFTRDVESSTAVVNRYEGDVGWLEKCLRESAGERLL